MRAFRVCKTLTNEYVIVTTPNVISAKPKLCTLIAELLEGADSHTWTQPGAAILRRNLVMGVTAVSRLPKEFHPYSQTGL